LIADIGHIAAASKVCLEIDLAKVPRIDGVSAMDAASSGEEYEIAVTAPEIDVAQFSQEFGLDLTEIGRVVAGPPRVELLEDGKPVAAPLGFDHFRDK
jgi:thiamine-monophosphate kinase